jgi:hypothetical protein
MKKNNKKILIAIGLSITLFFVFFLNFHTNHIEKTYETAKDTTKTEISPQIVTTQTVLEINGTRFEEELTNQTNVYDFMSKLQNEGKINFTEKTYIGMGKFIDSINGIRGNGEQNWIYYVNDKEASVGVSNYKINPGDVVSWKYEKENY